VNPHRVTILGRAEADLAGLPPEVRRRVDARMIALAANPWPPGSEALKGDLTGLRRLRVGDYRVAYHVGDAERVVTVVRIAHRSRFYQDLGRTGA
jgi:mRNA interferase RelE/StbE